MYVALLACTSIGCIYAVPVQPVYRQRALSSTVAQPRVKRVLPLGSISCTILEIQDSAADAHVSRVPILTQLSNYF